MRVQENKIIIEQEITKEEIETQLAQVNSIISQVEPELARLQDEQKRLASYLSEFDN